MTTRVLIRLFSSKDLAHALGINPARWKRWTRDFLPPDPLAGRQSGFARQFYLNDAFQVYLAGVLVSDLQLAVHEARVVLEELNEHLPDIGYRLDSSGRSLPNRGRYSLGIRKDAQGRLRCRLTGDGPDVGAPVDFGSGDPTDPVIGLTGRTLDLTACLKRFLELVDPEQAYFGSLIANLTTGD